MRAFRSRFASSLASGLRRLGHAARASTRPAVALAFALALGTPGPAHAQITTTTSSNVISAGLNGGGYFSVTTLPALNNGFTIEAWVRPVTHATWHRIADIGSGESDAIFFIASAWETGRPAIGFLENASANSLWLESPQAIPLGTWTHVAATLTSGRVASLYINGQVVSTGTANVMPSATAPNNSFIARSRWDPNIFNGSITDVRIWTTARTQAQIQAGMPVGSITGATTGLAAAYPFGSTGSGVLSDVSGAGRNLTQLGNVTFEKSGIGTVTTSGLQGTAALAVSAGTLNLNTTQTHTGGTVINGGALTLSGNYTGVGIIRGDVTVGPQGQLLLQDGVGLGWTTGSKVNTINVNGGLVYKTDMGGDGWGINYRMTGGELRANWGIFGSYPGSFFMMGGGSAITTLPSSTTALVSGSIRVREGNPNNALLFDVADGVASPDLLVTAGIADENGPNGITKTGAGLLALTGSPNLYSGTTTISAGTLQVGNGGTIGSLGSGNVVNNATLAFNRSDDTSVGNAISGTGSLLKLGGGVVTLTGNSTLSGTTTVSAGTLQVGNGGTSGSLGSGNVVNNATLVFNRSDTLAVGNVISGTGSVRKSGAGTLSLQSVQTYTGGTFVNEGTLQLSADGSDVGVIRGDVTIGSQGRLLLQGKFTLGTGVGTKVNTLTVNGGLVEAPASKQQWDGGWGLSYRLTGGELRANDGVSSASSFGFPFGGGSSVTTLASATPAVISGRVILFNDNPGNVVPIDVADGVANPDLNISAAITQWYPDTNVGITKTGAGTMALSGTSTYAGPTTVSAGTLALTGTGSIASSPTVTVAAGATFDVSGRSSAMALGASQTLANSGGTASLRGNLTATSGTVAMALANASTPAFTVSGGTLTLGAASTLRVSVSGTALAAGTYKLVSKGTGGSVSGPERLAVTVQGSGLASGQNAYAQVASGELFLRVVPTATITLGSLAQSYNGTARVASATTEPTGLAVSFTYNGSSTAPVAVGSYPVVATISDTNYVGTASGTLVVSRAQASITLGNLIQSYDGTARRVAAVTEPSGLSWTATYNGSANAPTNLGIYTVVATISDANYLGFTNGILNVKAGNPGARPAPTAQPPAYLNHHGYLTDAEGNPLGSPNPKNQDLIFRVFSTATGGSSLWTERQVVTVDQGEYDVMLGEGMSHGIEPWPSLDTVLASGTGTARFLEVTVRAIGVGGSDVTMAPRLILPSQPYAFLARHAQTAQTLVREDGNGALRITGNAVGVGIGNDLARATLDVRGGLTVQSLDVQGNITVEGNYQADSFTGDGTIPIGGIVVWSGQNVPSGWWLCDGSISYTFSNGVNTQGRRTPDLRGRFILGENSQRWIGVIGGSERHFLSENQMPSHGHVFDPPATSSTWAGEHSHSYDTHVSGQNSYAAGGDWGIRRPPTTDPLDTRAEAGNRTTQAVSHGHGAISTSADATRVGRGESHNGMPPFYVLAYIMRVQ